MTRTEFTLASILEPYKHEFINRYSNSFDFRKGSRFINATACPFCARYLSNSSCTVCPLDDEFGLKDGLIDNSGCKVVIRKLWGSITFGDYPDYVISPVSSNPQLGRINNWLMNVFGYSS